MARGLSAVAVINGKLYLAGGTAAGYANFSDLEIYDPVTNSWSKGPSLSNPLTSAAGVALNGKFYVLGGYVGPSAFDNVITAAVADLRSGLEHLERRQAHAKRPSEHGRRID